MLSAAASGRIILVGNHQQQQQQSGSDLSCGPDMALKAEFDRAALLATKCKRLSFKSTSHICQSEQPHCGDFASNVENVK